MQRKLAIFLSTTFLVSSTLSPHNTDNAKVSPLGTLQDALIRNAINTTASTGIENLVIEGGNWDTFKTTWEDNAKEAGIDAVAEVAAGRIGQEYVDGDLNYLTHKGAHALLGCGLGSMKSRDCGSGALGGVVGEILGENLGQNTDLSNKWVSALGQIGTVFAAGISGADAEVAQLTAKNAIENNALRIRYKLRNKKVLEALEKAT